MTLNTSEKTLLSNLVAFQSLNSDKGFSKLLSAFTVESSVKLGKAGLPTEKIVAYLSHGLIGNHSQFRQWLLGVKGDAGVNAHPEFIGAFEWAKGDKRSKLTAEQAAALQAALCGVAAAPVAQTCKPARWWNLSMRSFRAQPR